MNISDTSISTGQFFLRQTNAQSSLLLFDIAVRQNG